MRFASNQLESCSQASKVGGAYPPVVGGAAMGQLQPIYQSADLFTKCVTSRFDV